MARVVEGGKRATIDPLKHSQPLGGALVFLGLANTMPLLHGSQGCTAFAKSLLTRHFREPIPLQTTAVTEVSAVLGAGEALVTALDTIRSKQRPDIIGVLTTGLTEVSGEDVAGELRTYRESAGPDAPLIVGVSTPDFCGGLSEGWAAALEALVSAVPLDLPGWGTCAGASGGPVPPERLAVLAGPALSAVDLDEVIDLVTAFGLDPVVVPDLSGSVDGHLNDGWRPLTTGGTTLTQLRRLAECGLVATIGSTAAQAGTALAARTGAAVSSHRHLSGLAAVDALVAELMERTGVPAPPRLRHWRSRLADGLLDSHFVLGGARIALALEPEQLLAIGTLLSDVGAEIVTAVSPTSAPSLAEVPCEEVVVGDLDDLEERAGEAGAELVLASSHARAATDRLGAAHLPLGFPVHDRLGAQLRGTAGYRGSLQLLVDVANRLLDHRDHHTHAAIRPLNVLTGPQVGPSGSPNPLKESMC